MTDPATPAPAPQPPLTESEDRQWASFAHFGGIILGFLAPLIIWLIFKARGALVDTEGKEALNFQITVAIAHVANFILGAILTVVTFGIWSIIQILITLAIWVVSIIFCVQGGIKAQQGQNYRYPVAIRIIK